MPMRSIFVVAVLSLVAVSGRAEESIPANQQYLRFIKTLAHPDVRSSTVTDQEALRARQAELRSRLLSAWGGFPETPCPLYVQKVGEFDRPEYRVEKLLLQTFPGVRMTANAYVTKREGKLPAVLCVHGHWKEAKQAPAVQARCIGLAKLGYFVLAVDACGAGERAVGKALGEYHGEMTGAVLLPVGRPLSGIQVYENMRAVDYLQSRPEVNASKIGITGASGGGNQTMYAGAFDPRFQAVIPVCSVGTYNAYLGAACCMCEVVPGAARWCPEGEILGLVAPRGLNVLSATKDAFQFSVGEAQKSLLVAKQAFDLTGTPDALRHTVFEWHHDYSSAMREAMYGWMALHLKGEGDGSPLRDPEIQTEDPELLRCYPGESRPDDWVTLPKFAAAEARRLLAKYAVPGSATEWGTWRAGRLAKLRTDGPLGVGDLFAADPAGEQFPLGLPTAQTLSADRQVVVLLNLDSDNAEQVRSLREKYEQQGWAVLVPSLRATGETTPPSDKIGHAPDHNSAEWALWVGRPLLGQWTQDVRRVVDQLTDAGQRRFRELKVIGVGTAGPVALCAGALDERIQHVETVNSLASYVTDTPYRGQRLGIMAPGILRDTGDMAQLAALLAPRRLTITGGVSGEGAALSSAELDAAYSWTKQVYQLIDATSHLTVRSAE